MRIAVPVVGEELAPSPGLCRAVRFYEDDHGKIVRQSRAEPEGEGFDALLTLLERSGADVVLCDAPEAEERRALAASGLLTAQGYSGGADAAVRAWLGQAIACDPNNTCNYCGHRDECDLEHKNRDG